MGHLYHNILTMADGYMTGGHVVLKKSKGTLPTAWYYTQKMECWYVNVGNSEMDSFNYGAFLILTENDEIDHVLGHIRQAPCEVGLPWRWHARL